VCFVIIWADDAPGLQSLMDEDFIAAIKGWRRAHTTAQEMPN